jgi:hypothetical protein
MSNGVIDEDQGNHVCSLERQTNRQKVKSTLDLLVGSFQNLCQNDIAAENSVVQYNTPVLAYTTMFVVRWVISCKSTY